MSNKFKIAFSPSEDSWNVKDYRDLITSINDDTDSELYLISSSDNSTISSLVKNQLSLTDSYYFLYDTSSEIVQKLADSKILIFLSQDKELNDLINTDNPISLEENNVTGTKAIDVNFTIKDEYKVQFKYLTHLRFWTDQINKYDKKGE